MLGAGGGGGVSRWKQPVQVPPIPAETAPGREGHKALISAREAEHGAATPLRSQGCWGRGGEGQLASPSQPHLQGLGLEGGE